MKITFEQSNKFLDTIAENYIDCTISLLRDLGYKPDAVAEFMKLNLSNFEEVTRRTFEEYCDILDITEVEN